MTVDVNDLFDRLAALAAEVHSLRTQLQSGAAICIALASNLAEAVCSSFPRVVVLC